ncbi:non-canonical purine NTP diphosphatase [Flavobacteriaceae bacterium F89]|uniref:dITP/XTP pyrophosphatase n=1 Tax=Cerina litoralis TaxID=2874477 RepID=A0AAE3JPG2_9FLAO|nr:non-canonical purine NTP diphosphatase [Cerina litoralis]MCG2461011.1 non-canonical purine NTP diphosphatase [Cerina litoralis]
MKLVFATHNPNKFEEVVQLLPATIQLLSLDDIGCLDEIPETGDTLEENAKMKADFVTLNFGYSCFADDTGLLVDALNGAPGVHSARYAGEQRNPDDNIEKLISELGQSDQRSARFKTVIALNFEERSHLFSGIVEGEITYKRTGDLGFGYDSIFLPKGYDKTFAELPLRVKNQISHRGQAMLRLINHLKSRYDN